jgi:hypothetical protein
MAMVFTVPVFFYGLFFGAIVPLAPLVAGLLRAVSSGEGGFILLYSMNVLFYLFLEYLVAMFLASRIARLPPAHRARPVVLGVAGLVLLGFAPVYGPVSPASLNASGRVEVDWENLYETYASMLR